jgi:nucleolar protein 6
MGKKRTLDDANGLANKPADSPSKPNKKSKPNKVDTNGETNPKEHNERSKGQKIKKQKVKKERIEVHKESKDLSENAIDAIFGSPHKGSEPASSEPATAPLTQPINGATEDTNAPTATKKAKKDKKSKTASKKVKQQSSDHLEEATTQPPPVETENSVPLDTTVSEPSKSKDKKKKKKKSKTPKPQADTATEPQDPTAPEKHHPQSSSATNARKRIEKKANSSKTTSSHQDPSADDSNKSHRFIVFIGNLPFSATKESIASHFKAVSPTVIRAPTKKDSTTNESRGFAFLEFDGYDKMKSCLSLYHHSKFEDGKSPARRINVELT